MAKTAAKISIQLEAQTATLKKGFDEAKAAINGLSGSMAGSVAKGMAMFNAALFGVQTALNAVQGAVASVWSAMQAMGQSTDMAARLGITEDALETLKFAADQAGSSADGMVSALDKMKNSVAEAAQGTGAGAKALQELGLSVTDMMAMSPDEQFAAIADAIQGVSNESDITRLAMDLFGRSGADLIPILKGGSEGLSEYSAKAAELGILLGDSRADADEAADAVNRMKLAWGGIVNQIAIAVAPALEAIADALATVFGWFNRLMGRAQGATGEAKKYRNLVTKISIADPLAEKEKEAAAEAARVMEEEMARAAESIKSRGESISTSLRTPVEIYRDTIAELNMLVEKGAISWDTYNRGVRKAVEEMEKGKDTLQGYDTPAIGAVTRNSAAGFSAFQESKRQREDDDRRHKESIEWYRRIEEAVRASSLVLAPVKL
jgi:hypothetical protein